MPVRFSELFEPLVPDHYAHPGPIVFVVAPGRGAAFELEGLRLPQGAMDFRQDQEVPVPHELFDHLELRVSPPRGLAEEGLSVPAGRFIVTGKLTGPVVFVVVHPVAAV